LCPWTRLYPQQPQSLLQSYQQAVSELESDFSLRREKLIAFYLEHLETLARQAQQQGDLERLIVLKAEQDQTRERGLPPETDPPAGLEQVRDTLKQHMQTLSGEQAAARQRLDTLFLQRVDPELERLQGADQPQAAAALLEIKTVLLAQQAPAPTPEPEPEVRLGPNLFPNGSIDTAPDGAWRVQAPGGRNKSGLYQEPNSGMNMTLRFEQTERHQPSVHHPLKLKPGARYRVRWRTRLLVPWKSGIELRGKGYYRIGFRIPGHLWNAMTEAEQMKHRHRVDFARQPPPDREWRWMEEEIRVGPKQEELYISASQGEGDFLIDDLEIREILPPEPKTP
jgi:hypothetical protein